MKQFHKFENALTRTGNYPDPDIASQIDASIESYEKTVDAFESFLAQAETRNNVYAEEITVVTGQLEKDGLKPSPVSVLSREDFDKAIFLRNGSHVDAHGIYIAGHILIADNPEDFEKYGSSYLIGIGLHEGAHSSEANQGDLYMSHTSKPDSLGFTAIQGSEVHDIIGFQKFSWLKDKDPKIVGRFWEEAFADYYRVSRMEQLGIEWKYDGPLDGKHREGVIHYNAPTINGESDGLSLPVKYAGAIAKDSSTTPDIVPMKVSVAGYGLELLDQKIPGLFEDMMRSRDSREAYASFINKLENFQPGLYRALGESDDSLEGFQEGLLKIKDAIKAHTA